MAMVLSPGLPAIPSAASGAATPGPLHGGSARPSPFVRRRSGLTLESLSRMIGLNASAPLERSPAPLLLLSFAVAAMVLTFDLSMPLGMASGVPDVALWLTVS